MDHAVRLIHAVCCLAGSPTLIDDIRADLAADKVRAAIKRRDTGPVFEWLMSALSYQGISDQVAYEYMQRHGRATWREISRNLNRGATCPKIKRYWHFHGCRYEKISRTCAEPDHIGQCPLPNHNLRNGRLNQTAYSLFLFIHDIADGDLIGWIDRQLQTADQPPGADRLGRMRAAIIQPLRHVYGVSDKVLTMALSCLLLGAPKRMPLWIEVGGSMIAVDSLVHNFLHRTGILRRFGAGHLYGPGCYEAGGCAEIIHEVTDRIDARQFNSSFPQTFPRFIQRAIWRYCSQSGLDVCNGNRVDDSLSCANMDCRMRPICDRIVLRSPPALTKTKSALHS
jgi:hypothetical protein